MAKIAVIIGGLPRNYKDTLPYYKKMLDNHPVDTYIYTWDLFDNDFDGEGFNLLSKSYDTDKIIIDNYNDFEESIKDRIALFETIDYKRTGGFNLKTGLLTQHYTIKRAFSMIENPEKYDLIIRYRFDWFPMFTLDYDSLIIDSGPVFYSDKKINGLRPERKFCINDMFAVSNSKGMGAYCSLFDKLMTDDEYLDVVEETKCFIPEFILALHLRRLGVLAEGYDFPYLFRGRKYL